MQLYKLWKKKSSVQYFSVRCSVQFVPNFAIKMSESVEKTVSLVVDANAKLGYDAYKELIKTPGNALLCPLSVETILALTYMGAEGVTAAEFSKVLHLPTDKAATAEGFQKLTTLLKKSTSVTLNTANKLFIDKKFEILAKFRAIVESSFNAEADNVDFSDAPVALSNINNWVAKQTNDKIKSILEDVDPDTVMVLVNAIYFNGNWKDSFSLLPYKIPFRLNEKDSVDVDMMNRKGKYMYGVDEHLDAEILEIPYEGGDFSLVILLPKQVNGLAALEEKLPASFDDKLRLVEVDVTMPKFKLEQTIQFTEILQSLGMNNSFSDNANFSGISDTPVKISKVIQKTFIDVNEKGTEAAAATAVLMVRCCAVILQDPPVRFVADRPFHFILRHKNSHVVLFVGHYQQPVAS